MISENLGQKKEIAHDEQSLKCFY